MKEHPDYKYRPRRKPKPLNHTGNGPKKELPKYSFPLPVPFLPPGFDPCSFSAMARSIFAPPTYPPPPESLMPLHTMTPPTSDGGLANPRHTPITSLAPSIVPGFTPTVAFSHQDLAALFCMQQKSHYEKLLRDHQEGGVAEKRRPSSSSSNDDSKGK